MNFDDEDLRDFEKKNAEMLQQIRKISKSEMEQVSKKMEELLQYTKELLEKPHKTEEEKLQLKNLQEQLPGLVQKLNDIKLVLDESLYRQSEAYYFHIKALAEKGDEKAKAIYKELQPHYQAALIERTGQQN